VLVLVERAGNKAPHPAVLFFALIVTVVLLSHLLHLLFFVWYLLKLPFGP
jgi:p-aminobenzoyl-glutamate transporter AbgT